MDCKKIENLLIDYLDGKLVPREREAVELHAQSCTLCSERIDGFSNVSQALDSWEGMRISPSFNARLEQRLEQEASAPSWWSGFFSLPLAKPAFATALIAVILMGAALLKYSPVSSQTLAAQQAAQVLASADNGVDDLTLYQDLPVAEDLGFLGNFEMFQELSVSDRLPK